MTEFETRYFNSLISSNDTPLELKETLLQSNIINLELFYKFKNFLDTISKNAPIYIQVKCECYDKIFTYKLRTFYEQHKYEKDFHLCKGCNQSYDRGNYPIEILKYCKHNQAIPYDLFLKYKDKILGRRIYVEIKCKYCNKTALVECSHLIRRINHPYEQICNKCVYINRSSSNMVGTYYDIYFESSYELSFIHCCVMNNIPIRRCNIHIKYLMDGKEYNYYPDFIINNNEIVEIKGRINRAVQYKNEAAIKYCKENGYTYNFINYEKLKTLKNYIRISTHSLKNLNSDKLKFNIIPPSFLYESKPALCIDNTSKYIGFIYIIKNLITNEIIIDKFIGKYIDNFILSTKYSTYYKENTYKLHITVYTTAPSLYLLNIEYCKCIYMNNNINHLSLETIKNKYLSKRQWYDLRFVCLVDIRSKTWNTLDKELQLKILEDFSEHPLEYMILNVYNNKNNIIDTDYAYKIITKYNIKPSLFSLYINGKKLWWKYTIKYKNNYANLLLNNRKKFLKNKEED